MRLKQVSVGENEFENGLKAINMKNLGQVVALFGPNGAGKTRVLRSVHRFVEESGVAIGANGERRERDLKRAIKNENRVLTNLHEQMKKFVLEGHVEGRSRDELEAEINSRAGNLNKSSSSLEKHLQLKERVEISFDEKPSSPPVLVSLSFPIRSLKEVNSYPQSALDRSIEAISNWTDTNVFTNGVIPFLHNIARAAFNSKNPNANQGELISWLRLYEEAKRIIRLLMRMEFDFVPRGTDGLPALDGRPIRIQELSEGQRLLLIYTACLLKNLMAECTQSIPKSVRGAIVLIDEPELHLHPAAVIQFLESMRDVVGESGQIWLGTHAVCLLPHLRRGETWTITAGEVKPPGLGRSHEAVELLVGSEESVHKFESLLQEPDKWAAARFSAECLKPPGKVGFESGDPQMFQIGDLIKKCMEKPEEVCILDCGAGSGRLAIMLRETFTEEQQKLIKYVPVEPDESCHSEIKEAAGEMLADCGVILSVEGIPSEYAGNINVAVLCNVLHEIRPTKWCHELNVILKKVSVDGFIIICEDQRMPKGELPNELGYLVLGTGEIQSLFALKRRLIELTSEDEKYKGRLLCVEVPVREAEVTSKSVRTAIENLRGRLDGLIEQMRGKSGKPSAKDGRDYAFHSQMFVNCLFALKEVKKR